MDYRIVIFLVVIIFVYATLGGIAFHLLESPHEQNAQSDIAEFIVSFQNNFTCVSPDDLVRLVAAVKKAQDSGVVPRNTTDPNHTNWDYQSAIFFSVTVITTIGYGQISPITNGGRTFCAFYAFFGIPLFLITAGALGEKLRIAGNKIQEKASCNALKHRPKIIKVLTTLLVLIIGFMLFMVLPAVIFHVMESWTLTEAMYYVYITLTTIGFGDYVPGEINVAEASYRGIYRLATAFWILIGLTWMAGVISTVQDIFSDVAEKADNKVTHSDEEPTDDEKNTNDDLLKKEIRKDADDKSDA